MVSGYLYHLCKPSSIDNSLGVLLRNSCHAVLIFETKLKEVEVGLTLKQLFILLINKL